MWSLILRASLKPLLAAAALSFVACASWSSAPAPKVEVGSIEIGSNLQLRRMVVQPARPRGTVLLLHGFPETLHVWKPIALALGSEYEVHAFDWPGYGQSSRPTADVFSYAPRAYASVLKAYIEQANLDTARLVIYATDIGALPALLLALEEPRIAQGIIVGDFAPFDRPQLMQPSLQSLKDEATANRTRAAMNRNRDEILTNAWRRGLSPQEQFEIPRELQVDLENGWDGAGLTSADAFYHYYSHFTADQHFFEARLTHLRTPVKVVWGERDFYIAKEMGVEFADRVGARIALLPGVGHYPHLQQPQLTVEEIRAFFAR